MIQNNTKTVLNANDTSIFSLNSSNFKEIREVVADTISFDFVGNLDKEALWTEHNIHSTEKTRILNILKDGINSMSVALSLDVLMKDKDFLLSSLSEQDFNTVLDGYENYWKEALHPHAVIFSQYGIMDHSDLCKIINILSKNGEICDRARLIVSTRNNYYNIYGAFEQLTTFFIKILNTAVKTEKHHDQFIVDVWNKNDVAKKKIQELEMMLNDKQKTNSKLMGDKLEYIHFHMGAVTSLQFKCVEQIKREEKIVEREMINEVYEYEKICKKLHEESKQLQIEYETLLANHLKTEKGSRKTNIKIETQLFTLMEKYDLEMIERQDRYDDLNKKYLDEKLLHDEIRTQFEEQEPIYDILMIEKYEYLDKIWNEKFQTFVQNLAAKRIQRCYRHHRKYVIKKRKAAQALYRLQQARKEGKSTMSTSFKHNKPAKSLKKKLTSKPTKSSKK